VVRKSPAVKKVETQGKTVSLEKIRELLTKQKLIQGMVHEQQMLKHNLVETIVHRQHMSEIRGLLATIPTGEIASLLESVPLVDAQIVWKQIPVEREDDVLWELNESLREALAQGREPIKTDSQINAFELIDGRLKQVEISSRKDFEGISPVWIDLLGASKAELKFVGQFFALELPFPGESTDLEVSTRFHVLDTGEVHLRSNFLLDREGNSRSVPVAFIVHHGILFSIRNEELPVFRLQRRRARTEQGYVTDCRDILLDLYGADVEYSADSLEDIYETLGKVGRKVLSERVTDEDAAGILGDIAEEEDLNGRIRSNILDTQRALSFLMRNKGFSQNQLEDAKQILRNIESLNSHTSFLFDKINFLMDATIGFININQNKRVNQLTVFGVVFMPINILAGVGGMSEFSMMTEGIPWPVSYGAFILGLGFIGWATYVMVKHLETRKLKAKSGNVK
jgi:magnesium transporter